MLASRQAAIDFLRAYAEAGCEHLCMMPAVADLDQVELLADVVAEAGMEAA
jgi:2-methylisocitrate lyase-like PEP mutase family enzyme